MPSEPRGREGSQGIICDHEAVKGSSLSADHLLGHQHGLCSLGRGVVTKKSAPLVKSDGAPVDMRLDPRATQLARELLGARQHPAAVSASLNVVAHGNAA